MEQFGADFADEKQTAFAGTAGSKSKQVKESVPLLALDSAHSGRQRRPHKGF